jgi:starch synthase
MNWLKGAIAMADAVTTVSPSYAREIQESERGHGLHEVLREHRGKLTGILNGIDMVEWNPAKDGALKKNFKLGSMAGRVECRAALEKEMGIEPANGRPIFGMVTRLTKEKGVDLVWAGVEELVRRGGRLVVLGAGDPALEEEGKRLAQLHPKRVAVRLGYDEGLARRIFGGADFFLMPSRSEPCGLTQMYAMRYGTVPLVRATGGLVDTVVDTTPETLADGTASGFMFEAFDPVALEEAVCRALDLHADRATWDGVVRRVMVQDWSWDASAREYLRIYQRALATP